MSALGILEMVQGNLAASRAWLERSLIGLKKFGDRQFANISRSALADLSRLEKDSDKVFRLYLETINEWRLIGNKGAIARCLECMAFVSVDQVSQTPKGNERAWVHQALCLLGKADSLRSKTGAMMMQVERVEYDQMIARLRNLVPAAEFSQTWEEGERMDLDQLLAQVGSDGLE